MIVEILRFKLAPGSDEAAFLEADKRLQTEFAYQQPGMIRRTTARGDDGAWTVIDFWNSRADAERCDELWSANPIAETFMKFVDQSSISTERFETLD
ncbi:MAG TPA: antibiotic biosynthesis monooxygenase [Acidimicrobiales bacterium]